MQPLSLNVFFFEQTAQASTCQTFHRAGVRRSGATRRSGAQRGGLSSVPSRLPPTLVVSPSSQPSENFTMSLETILIIVLIVFLLGGGGWYWGRGRG